MKQSSGAAAAREKTRSESDKEKTKLRERQRRAITTRIFHGLRKHGGYINEVLRHLAADFGWTVLPDGTTFRSSSPYPLCGGGAATPTATPASSAAADFSTPQPRLGGAVVAGGPVNSIPLELYVYGSLAIGGVYSPAAVGGGYQPRVYLEEDAASRLRRS